MSDDTLRLLRKIEDLERRLARVETRENPNGLDPYYVFLGHAIRDDFIDFNGVRPYWAGWSNTPGSSVVSGHESHMLRAVTSAAQNGVTCLLYNNRNVAAGDHFGACVACDGTFTDIGIRLDDGTDNNYLEWILRSNATATNGTLVERHREAAGAVVTNVVYTNIITTALTKMRIACSTTSQFYMYLDATTQSSYDYGYTAGTARAYTRHGIVLRANTAAARAGSCHWYSTTF